MTDRPMTNPDTSEALADELDRLFTACLETNSVASRASLEQALWDNKAGIIAALRASLPGRTDCGDLAWLIEWPENDNSPARWWHPFNGWMRDANKAVRFARECDAADYITQHLMLVVCEGIKPTEHKWVNRAALPPTLNSGADASIQHGADYLQEELDKLGAHITYTACKVIVSRFLSLPRAVDGGADDLEKLVSRFAARLLAKLKLARAIGRSGWERDDWEADCQRGLLRHIEKGDPRDVAAYCAFMDHHGWITKAALPRVSTDVKSTEGK